MLLMGTTMLGQGLEEDNMVLYMKANVLFESGRYDEAVRMYNRILNDDMNHTNAIFMRAKAKYELGAFQGTKKDVMLFIDKAGVTKDIIKLMAQTELDLSNLKAAENYVRTAIELDPYDDKMHLLFGDISMDAGNRSDACESYATSANLGSQKAVQRMQKRCNGYQPRSRPESNQSSDIQEGSVVVEEEQPVVKEERKEGEIVTLEDIVREAENNPTTNSDPAPSTNSSTNTMQDINASQEIVIDQQLNITIENGLGARKLDSKPSIFMLSDQDGRVVIDVCVGSDGKVTEASFNREQSTIYRSSLTSLALRKAKEFVFERSTAIEDCGTMIYNIKS